MGHSGPVEAIIVRLPKVKRDQNFEPARSVPERQLSRNHRKLEPIQKQSTLVASDEVPPSEGVALVRPQVRPNHVPLGKYPLTPLKSEFWQLANGMACVHEVS